MSRVWLRRWIAAVLGFSFSVAVLGVGVLWMLPRWVQLDSHRSTLERSLTQLFSNTDTSPGKWTLGELSFQVLGGVTLSTTHLRWEAPTGETLVQTDPVRMELEPSIAWELAWSLMTYRWTGDWGARPKMAYPFRLSSTHFQGKFENGVEFEGPLELSATLAWEGWTPEHGPQSVQGELRWNGTQVRIEKEDRFSKEAGVPFEAVGKWDWSPLAFRWSEGSISLDGSPLYLTGANTQWVQDDDADAPITPGPLMREWTLSASQLRIAPWFKAWKQTRAWGWEGFADVEWTWKGPSNRIEEEGHLKLKLDRGSLGIPRSQSGVSRSWAGSLDASIKQGKLEHLKWDGISEEDETLSLEAAVIPATSYQLSPRIDLSVSGEGVKAETLIGLLQSGSCLSITDCLETPSSQRWSGTMSWDFKNLTWKTRKLTSTTGKMNFAPGQLNFPLFKGVFEGQGQFDGVFGFQKKEAGWVYRYSWDSSQFPVNVLDPSSGEDAFASLKLEGTGKGWGWPEVLRDWNAKGKLTLMGTPGIVSLGMDRMEGQFTVTQGQLFATKFLLDGKTSEEHGIRVQASGKVALEKPYSLQLKGEFLELNQGRKAARTWVNVGCDWKAPCIQATADSKYQAEPGRKKARPQGDKRS